LLYLNIKRWVFIAFLVLAIFKLQAQCYIVVKGLPCKNNPIQFSVTPNGTTNPSWNFNNEGFNNSSVNPTFTFSTIGSKTITYSCRLPNGQVCNASTTIVIKDQPKVNLRLLNAPIQCYDNNQFCFVDSSMSGDNNYCIKTIKYLFSDGELITRYGSKNAPVKMPFSFCKSYLDPQGGAYSLTVEIEDCNGCIIKQQLPFVMKVELLPVLFATSDEKTSHCSGTVNVKFTNSSQIAKTNIKSFYWDFGDGTKDFTQWDSVYHQYSSGSDMSKGFSPKLVVYTLNGCRTEFALKDVIVYNFKPYITKDKDSICVGDVIHFELHPSAMKTYIDDSKVRWDFDPGLQYGYDVTNGFSELGPHIIGCYVPHACGPYILKDTVVVIGPKARIEPDFISSLERYQCKIRDTVNVVDRSEFYHNDSNFLNDDSLLDETPNHFKYAFKYDPKLGRMVTIHPYDYLRSKDHVKRLWDFDDPYCLPCTTDRKKGQNVDRNCRYSLDSSEQHIYSDWDSVYAYWYAKLPLQWQFYDPVTKSCRKRAVWTQDSLLAVVDSVVYYGDNVLGIAAKDSSIFSGKKRKIKIASGLFNQGSYSVYSDLLVYVPNGSSVLINPMNGNPGYSVPGPQYYKVLANQTLEVQNGQSCYFVYGLKQFYDTLLPNAVKPYHSLVHKVALPIAQTDTINANLHRRLFYKTIARCFKISLTLKDTVHPFKCESRAGADLALMPPSAKRLSIDDQYCYGYDFKVIEFNLEDTKPGCMASFVQFNPDYVKNPNNWLLLNNLTYGEINRNVFLNATGPYTGYAKEGPNGGKFFWVYNDSILNRNAYQALNIGLIIGNGIQPNECVDTVLYQNFASFPRLKPDIVFATNNASEEHSCKDTFVYVTLPFDRKDANALADASSWYIIDNWKGDTLEQIDEQYRRVVDHWAYPGKKVNYTVIVRYKWVNAWPTEYKRDTIVTAMVNAYKPFALPGVGLKQLRQRLALLGIDINDVNDTSILDLIWNGKGTLGNPLTGSRGCIDTSGFGHQIHYRYQILKATVLHFRDSSLMPYDTFSIHNIDRQAYAFRVKRQSSYNIYRAVSSLYPGFCTLSDFVTVAVGFKSKITFSDSIICRGQTIEAKPEFKYFSTDSTTFNTYDSNDYWYSRRGQAGSWHREGVTIWDYSKADDNPNQPNTVFGNFPYVKKGYAPSVLLGNEPNGIYYRTPGVYTLRVLGIDSNQCTDTFKQNIYVTGPKAGFYTDIVTPNCKTILEFFDTSYIVDPCQKAGLSPCDFIYQWTIDFGDGSPVLDYFKQLPKQIGHDYTKNGYYQIKLTIQSVLGCVDTVSHWVFIPGPSPDFKPISSVYICVGDSVKFKNLGKNFTGSSQWLWNFGDTYFAPQKDTSSIAHRYMKAGVYDVYLTQFDSIPQTGKYCANTFPDTAKQQAKITVYVSDWDQFNLKANPMIVCVGDSIRIQAQLTSVHAYKQYHWQVNQMNITNQTLNWGFVPQQSGAYTITWQPDTAGIGLPYCPDNDTVTVYADSVLADFTIDESQKPIYCFDNTSKYAVEYRWGFYHDTDITFKHLAFKQDQQQFEPERRICQNFSEHQGVNWICLEAINPRGCVDTVCKKINNDFEVAILPPNVFTPSGNDGFKGTDREGLEGNNVFNIYTKNVADYHLQVFDRWGVKVFESDHWSYDWNGKVMNTGTDCPDGTYYYILNYRYVGRDKDEPILNGVVRLIRE